MKKNDKHPQDKNIESNEFSNKFLFDDISYLESTRINYLKFFIFLSFISLLLLSGVCFFLNKDGVLSGNEIVALILLFFICLFLILYPCDKFSSIVEDIIADKLSYSTKEIKSCKEILCENEIKNCGIIDSIIHTSIKKSFIGEHNGVKFNIADIGLRVTSQNFGFVGIVLFFEFYDMSFPRILYTCKNRHFIIYMYYLMYLFLAILFIFSAPQILVHIGGIFLFCFSLIIMRIQFRENKNIVNDISVLKNFNLLKLDINNTKNTSLLSTTKKIDDLAKTFNGKIEGVSFKDNKILIFIHSNQSCLIKKQSLFDSSLKQYRSLKLHNWTNNIFDFIDYIKKQRYISNK